MSPRRLSASLERQPLLHTDNISHAGQNDNPYFPKEYLIGEEGKPLSYNTSVVLSELWILLRTSVPLIFSYLLQYSLTLVTMAVAGHLSSLDIAATSLAMMTSYLTGLGIYEGSAAALDTLCAQAYGANKPEMVGVHIQRMAHLMLLCTIPITLMWISSSHWLGYVVSNPDLAARAGQVMALLAVGNPGYLLWESGRRLAQAQGLFDAPLYVMLAALPTHIFFSWLFVSQFHWGLTGLTLALSVTRTLFPVYFLAYILIVKPSALQCWGGIEPFAPQKWYRMIRLAIPGVCIVEAEILIFEFLTLGATYLSVPEAAAQSVITTVVVVLAHIPIAFGVAVATRVGNLVGSEDLYTAKITMLNCVVFSVVLGGVDGALLYLFKDPIIRIFTQDSVVVDFTKAALPILVVFLIPQHAAGAINGMLRGIGKQGRGAWINFGFFAMVGVPAGLHYCFVSNLRLSGLWLGAMIAYIVVAIICGVYGLTSNLRKVAQKIRDSE